jgi:hypothetical protein
MSGRNSNVRWTSPHHSRSRGRAAGCSVLAWGFVLREFLRSICVDRKLGSLDQTIGDALSMDHYSVSSELLLTLLGNYAGEASPPEPILSDRRCAQLNG